MIFLPIGSRISISFLSCCWCCALFFQLAIIQSDAFLWVGAGIGGPPLFPPLVPPAVPIAGPPPPFIPPPPPIPCYRPGGCGGSGCSSCSVQQSVQSVVSTSCTACCQQPCNCQPACSQCQCQTSCCQESAPSCGQQAGGCGGGYAGPIVQGTRYPTMTA